MAAHAGVEVGGSFAVNPNVFPAKSMKRYGSGRGSCGARVNAALRNGASASIVTTHGEIVVAKLFERKGPSGWYSHAWMSRADQSFSGSAPKT
jgi:hypothetical protein